jgi:GTPase SAR1 family protein
MLLYAIDDRETFDN